MLIAAALTLTVVITAFVYLLVRRLTRPLESAVRAVEEIAAGKLAPLPIGGGSDEIARLSGAINSVVGYLSEMSNVADRIAAGDVNVSVRARSTDDRLGGAFQNMLGQAYKLTQTGDERDRLQRSIMKLLEEVADVANGNLTAEAEVTSDATGAIADAFNYMIVELRGLIGQVKQTSLSVDSSANEIKAATENLLERSESQSTQLIGLSATLEKMAGSLQTVAADTDLSAQVSTDALANAKQGSVAVNNNMRAMNDLRNLVQQTAERLRRLDERSGEIGSIVKIINDLAQRTSVLALNASIQATAAGAAGRGFVRVAEEVERLADRSASASKQIDVLTKAIQGETSEAVAAMEATVKEAAIGVRLTGEVGDALSEIEAVTGRLAEISQNIARAAGEQAKDSAQISTAMRSVAAASETGATEMKESAANAARLATWAQQLRSSVAPFRLPETTAQNFAAPPAAAADSQPVFVN